MAFAATFTFFDTLSEWLFDDKKVGLDIKVKCLNPKVAFKSFKFLPLTAFQSTIRKAMHNKVQQVASKLEELVQEKSDQVKRKLSLTKKLETSD